METCNILKWKFSDAILHCFFPIKPISGGFMHRMYRVRTKSGIYAVKHLNPEIVGREGVHTVDGHYFYVFNWQDGHITDWYNISNDECKTAGNILGRIHAIDPDNHLF